MSLITQSISLGNAALKGIGAATTSIGGSLLKQAISASHKASSLPAVNRFLTETPKAAVSTNEIKFSAYDKSIIDGVNKIKPGSYRPKGSWWSLEKEPHDLAAPSEIINPTEILALLAAKQAHPPPPEEIRRILAKAYENATLKDVKACELKGEFVQALTQDEIATLLCTNWDANPELEQEMFDTALRIKERVYGKRIVLFAPMYVANYCSNTCDYCGFRSANADLHRVHLTNDEVRAEAEALIREGHKRTLMLCGESPKYTFDDFLSAVETVRDTRVEIESCHSKGKKIVDHIRRINVEIPVLSVSDLRRLKATNAVGTYAVFQETYNPVQYRRMHTSGPKSDFAYRLSAMDRSQIAGVDDVGLGILFGLYDYKYEVLALIQHAEHLMKTFGVGPHTISIPRLQPAANAKSSQDVPFRVSDPEIKRIVAILRMAVPYSGMILTTRESPEMRNELLKIGMSQMSGGSRTDPGSYAKARKDKDTQAGAGKNVDGQFQLSDHRELEDVVADLLKEGFIPSSCTSCYKIGRTGTTFLEWAKTGAIQNMCHPNALITLKEYSEDYGSDQLKNQADKLIKEELKNITSAKRRKETLKVLKDIKNTNKREHLF